jgi:predicted RNA-binding protein with PIN domain
MKMEEFLIVDGYNVINSWEELKKLREESFEHARNKLVGMVANYAGFYGIEAMVVFDAHLVKGGAEKQEQVNGVKVIYSKEGETADMVIERTVSSLSRKGIVCVVTSDWIEQQLTLGKGGVRLSAREFWQRVKECGQETARVSKELPAPRRLIDQLVGESVRETLEKWRRKK